MEIQGAAIMKLLIDKNAEITTPDSATTPNRQKWKIAFYRSSSSITTKTKATITPHHQRKPETKQPPKEFLCPISSSLMADPVIVSSGHTFERACVHACKSLGFTPTLHDGISPDFSTAAIPNLALRSTILNWCREHSLNPPNPLDFSSAEKLVRTLLIQESSSERRRTEQGLIRGVKNNPSTKFSHAVTELTRRPANFYSSSSSDESSRPLQLTTRPSCYSSSSSSSSELEPRSISLNSSNEVQEEYIVQKLKSPQVHEVEEAVIFLRKLTRNKEETRVSLCTPRLLLALRSLITSRYTNVQVNAMAILVNLSLEKINKVLIVRSGLVPPVIDVLKAGSAEAQEHACGAIFSLALDDHNKTALGVLGALPPLLHLLKSESERTRHDSALALYHLSLVKSNRTKLVKLGSVSVLLGMVKCGHPGRALLILGNLASCPNGRVAVLDAGGVEFLVGMLRDGTELSESTQESCASVLYSLSRGGLRFKGLAAAAGMAEVLMRMERVGSEHAKEKAKRMLELMKARDEEEEEDDVDWEELLDSGLVSRSRYRLGCGRGESVTNSSEF